jgi:hypothetical protein
MQRKCEQMRGYEKRKQRVYHTQRAAPPRGYALYIPAIKYG